MGVGAVLGDKNELSAPCAVQLNLVVLVKLPPVLRVVCVDVIDVTQFQMSLIGCGFRYRIINCARWCRRGCIFRCTRLRQMAAGRYWGRRLFDGLVV